MTDLQKQRIEYLRGKGKSYAVIAADLKISENTIKSYCRRNNLGAGYVIDFPKQTEEACDSCGKPLEQTAGSRRKRFCSDKCRMLWWKAYPERMNQKAVYDFTCAHCNTVFSAYGNKKRKYCSHDCYVSHRFGKGAAL